MAKRDDFLAHIRGALGYSAAHTRSLEDCQSLFSSADDSAILKHVRYRTHVEKQALVRLFQENAEAINLRVQVVPSFESAADEIVSIVKSTEPEFGTTRQIIQHDHPDINEMRLWKKLAGESVLLHTTYPADSDLREKLISSYIGITAPQWAVAESAAIVQITKAEQPRSTSLVPSIHIAVLRIENLLADLVELYALLRENPPESSCVFISGPSKTADIEAHMVHGAHGPKEMHVIVIDGHMIEENIFQGSGIFSSA